MCQKTFEDRFRSYTIFSIFSTFKVISVNRDKNVPKAQFAHVQQFISAKIILGLIVN